MKKDQIPDGIIPTETELGRRSCLVAPMLASRQVDIFLTTMLHGRKVRGRSVVDLDLLYGHGGVGVLLERLSSRLDWW